MKHASFINIVTITDCSIYLKLWDYAVSVHECLDQQFPGHWRGRTGSQEWPLRSPDFFL